MYQSTLPKEVKKHYLPSKYARRLAESDLDMLGQRYKDRPMVGILSGGSLMLAFAMAKEIDGDEVVKSHLESGSIERAVDLFDFYSKIVPGRLYYTTGIVGHQNYPSSPTLSIAIKHHKQVFTPSENNVFNYGYWDNDPRMTVIDPCVHIFTSPENQRAYVDIEFKSTINKKDTKVLWRTTLDNHKRKITKLLEKTLEECDVVEVRNYNRIINGSEETYRPMPDTATSFDISAEDKDGLYGLIMEYLNSF